jgi:beta-lactamase class A
MEDQMLSTDVDRAVTIRRAATDRGNRAWLVSQSVPAQPVDASETMPSMSAVDFARAERAVERFVNGEPGRSIAVETLGGPPWSRHHDAQVSRPAASLLKIPIVMAVHRAAHAGSLDFDERVRVDELPASRFMSVLDVLDSAHGFTLRELSGLALATSDNRVAQYLIGLVGMAAVNDVLRHSGCEASKFAVGFADHELSAVGRDNVSTAGDMLRLLSTLHRDDQLRSVLDAMERSPLNARIPLRLPDDGRISVANKTGSLAGVVNDVGIIGEDGLVLAVAVLCDGQRDNARTSIEIGDCVRELWGSVGGRLDS